MSEREQLEEYFSQALEVDLLPKDKNRNCRSTGSYYVKDDSYIVCRMLI